MKGPPVSVAKEFNAADKGGKMLRRGMGAARAKAMKHAGM
jgi:hypothetical protein